MFILVNFLYKQYFIYQDYQYNQSFNIKQLTYAILIRISIQTRSNQSKIIIKGYLQSCLKINLRKHYQLIIKQGHFNKKNKKIFLIQSQRIQIQFQEINYQKRIYQLKELGLIKQFDSTITIQQGFKKNKSTTNGYSRYYGGLFYDR
ncbi:unnamed protein product [Paramecium sonneborni]|uniref:Uncharacterized protein n=1 Tax=Paramecium sonneborni TaxID=65129 RepID=A0A8S1KDM0_9CILI|nr:unnamed protein product [Paramecium sonneborni]